MIQSRKKSEIHSAAQAKREADERMRRLRGLWRPRGMTISKLAKLICSDRTHVGQVLRGAPGRGGHTRSKLARHLTSEELDVLGWDGHVTRGTCSTGNKGG